jgi:hypothetical protein
MRIAAGLLAVCVLGLGLWHARPVLVWHLTVAPEIERIGRSERVQLDTARALPTPDPAWPRLRAGRLALRAPIATGQLELCESCADGCRLELGDGGWLALFDSKLEPYRRSVNTFAPTFEDLSLWRPRAQNWLTVEALAARASVSTPPLHAFRYETETSRGIVSRVVSRGNERFVVYAFAPNGSPGGTLAVSRAGLPAVKRMLGGLVVGDKVDSPHCEIGGST